jgi:ElaA protein
MDFVHREWSALSADELYALLALRAEVFVVEQSCPYQDLDGADRRATHLWIPADDGAPLAYARLFAPGVKRAEAVIGRVVSAPAVRRHGYGRAVFAEAMRRLAAAHGPARVWISAQKYLQRFYEGFGFRRDGDDYLEDGIPHLPMAAAPGPSSSSR